MLPKLSHPLYKVIPFENYFMLMVLSGLPAKEIKSFLIHGAFNLLSDELLKYITDQCRSHPGWEVVIASNRSNYSRGYEINVPDEILEDFRFPDYARDIVNWFDNKFHKRTFSGFGRVKKILERWDERAFVETAALENIPMASMVKKWNASHEVKNMKFSSRTLAVYYYYYWNVTWKHLDSQRTTVHDVLDYININKKSKFYDIHRYMAFRQPVELFHYFGLMSNVERIQTNKSILGDAVKVIRTAQRNGLPVPDYASDLFKTINAELALHARDEKDVDVYRVEVERIISRVSVVHKERESIVDLNRPEILEEQAPVPELDKPFNVKK